MLTVIMTYSRDGNGDEMCHLQDKIIVLAKVLVFQKAIERTT